MRRVRTEIFNKNDIKFLDEYHKGNLTEAFRAGKSAMVVEKLASILSRKTGRKVRIPGFPVGYKNSIGEFIGYKGYFNRMPIRVNFLLSSSEELYSIDMYENSNSIIPTRTIMLEGYNIVQVINQIAEILSGEFEIMESSAKFNGKRLTEKTTLADMVADWLEENPAYMLDIQKKKFVYEDHTDEFVDYIRNKFNSNKTDIKAGSLQYNVKQAIKNNSNLQKTVHPKSVPGVSVQKGVADKASLILDKEAREAYENAVINNDAREAFVLIEKKTRAMAQDKPFTNGMFIYGRPGTGKTFTVEQVLNEEGSDWEAIKGGIDGADALLAILYMHNEDKIILFDDNDSVMASQKAINILKIALGGDPVRALGFGAPFSYGKGKENKINVPAKFDFTSKIIFISNLTKIDPAIQSRLSNAIFELNFSLDDMYELIKTKLPKILSKYPQITDDLRWEVYDFITKLKPVAEDIDFRRYEACLQEALAADGDKSYWQKRAAAIMALPRVWDAA